MAALEQPTAIDEVKDKEFQKGARRKEREEEKHKLKRRYQVILEEEENEREEERFEAYKAMGWYGISRNVSPTFDDWLDAKRQRKEEREEALKTQTGFYMRKKEVEEGPLLLKVTADWVAQLREGPLAREARAKHERWMVELFKTP